LFRVVFHGGGAGFYALFTLNACILIDFDISQSIFQL